MVWPFKNSKSNSTLDEQSKSLRKELRSIRRSGIRTAFVVLFLISGLTPACCLFWQSSNELSLIEQLKPVGKVVLHTYPLTLAVALITFSRRRKWLRWGKWFFAAAVIAVAAQLGNFVGDLTGTGHVVAANVFEQPNGPLLGIPVAGINHFVGFYQHYGPRVFFSSLFIGIFAGATASRILTQNPDRKTAAKSLAAELDQLRRKVA